MNGSAARKLAAREKRFAQEAQARARAATRKRMRTVAGTILVAVALVVVAVAISSGHAAVNASSGAPVQDAAFSKQLFAGIPQRGTLLGRPDAPVHVVEFADLQCPYCDEYAVQALPTLVRDYVRTRQVSMRFENLSFIGPDSVTAGHAAAAAAEQNKLWNFVDLLYLNQGEENSGYVTSSYVHRLFDAVPNLNIPAAVNASHTAAAGAALTSTNTTATRAGVSATPSFLIGRAGGPLRLFQPSTLTAAPFAAEFNTLLSGGH
ncbi:MAG TPA: thioredoxin domain-containing protein [Solirubrobacteraceae bacterium]|nr:thioredoxin domain-containing protein [Solirubrobacteraceae bacterium]